MPWKNGGGTTTEVAIEPPGATLATGFAWRISMADVMSDGPFSRFPGYDRALAILSGGMVLQGLGAGDTTLSPHIAVTFAGENDVFCRLLDGPLRDYNVMTRRAAVSAELAFAALHSETPFRAGSDRLVLTLLTGPARLDSDPAELALLTTLVLEPGETAVLAPTTPAALGVAVVRLSYSSAAGS